MINNIYSLYPILIDCINLPYRKGQVLESVMPELPEVETTIRYLKPAVLNQVITDITVTNKGESTFNIPFDEVRGRIIGNKITDIGRHGKWMLFEFNNGKAIGHLRMSGRYKVDNKVLDLPHNRFQLHLDSGKIINYIDQRRFGTFHFVDRFENYPGLKKLGPDILLSEVTAEYLHSRLLKTKKPIYSALLDQSIVAGLGNIYVNEVLHACGIHPLTLAEKITLPDAKLILQNSKIILSKALELKGTTLIDNLYRDPEGKTGQFAKMLQVYGKKKDPSIQVLKIGGRSVFVHKDTNLIL